MTSFDGALAASAAPLALLQAALMLVDERVFHRERALGQWESWSHVADSAAFAAALAPAALLAPTQGAALAYAALALASTALVTKDEWIHARECGGTEQWLHALLFALHPCVLIAIGASWARGEGGLLRAGLPVAVAGYSFYQWRYWIGGRRFRRETLPLVDNEFYDELGERWHEGDVHAIALLRAETPTRLAYVRGALARAGLAAGARILDVGCGGGFLSNPLAGDGYRVKGVDRSAPSLEAARTRVPAGADAAYAVGDALALAEPGASYDAVLMMDLLEHLDEPARAVAEAARALKPGGLLIFHTFNRTPEAWLLAVKGIGFVTREGPSNVHSYRMFVTPAELEAAGRACGLEPLDLTGIRPVLDAAFASSLLRRRVHPDFAFALTRSTRVGYLGCLRKTLAAALALLLAAAAAPARAAGPSHRFALGPEEVRTLDSGALAERLVARIHDECDLAGAPASGEKALGDDYALVLMVPTRLLDSIVRGGFLNQHQTRTTGGHHRESDRFEAEQELAMLRLPFDRKGLELLPKYAVLDVKKESLGTFRLPTQYGAAAVVFKPAIAARATWTYADSLDYSRKTGRFDAGGAANPVLAHTFLYERKNDDPNRCGNYCEAQIWGPLTLNDAAYVMIQSSEAISDAVAESGLPVYDYSVPDSTSAIVDSSRTAQYVRGALRLAGTPARRRREADVEPMGEAALIEAVGKASPEIDVEGGFSPRQRLIGELAARVMSPAVAAALEKEFSSDDAQTRSLALYGLSELPWTDFKPRLLEGLRAPNGPLLISAVAFSAEHRDDADVAARLDALRRGPRSDASEWLERLDKVRLCDPR